MHALVTGAAGFIGSHLTERLLQRGWTVRGVDAFLDYYPRPVKEKNLQGSLDHPAFTFVEADLVEADPGPLVDGVEVVFHLAAQAGVRASWGEDFHLYTANNIDATQRLLEAAARSPKGVRAFVFASSSSVYGDVEAFPMREDGPTRPISPYGITKLAGEALCALYERSYGVPAVALRYFTVFGPRQRPDMAFHRFIRAVLDGEPLHVFGDGEQTRDFTYVADAVEATIAAAERGRPGALYNVGGGARVTINVVIEMLARLAGAAPDVHHDEAQRGDMRHTVADITRARDELGWRPSFELEEGLARQLSWLKGGW
ncbi:MAG: NAD-dependent epimerase/dehydratase family protein [bacterium]|nr:NAD-dependent epimerase/dehydratase family protein [bacterium]